MSDYDKITRGDAAARYLADPLFADILNEIREDAIKSLTTDQGAREDNIAMIRAVENLRQTLQSIVTTGKNAANRQG